MKQKLIDSVVRNKDVISYINLNDTNEYRGWTYDFNITLPSGEKMALNLSEEDDLFLLFVLAASWSKTGPWENAAFFTTYLKLNHKNKVKHWLNNDFVMNEISNRELNCQTTVNTCEGIIARKKVSFRKDYFSSVTIIAKSWNEIKTKLEASNRNDDYDIFINYISELEGLGSGKNKMRIKIPLILRELRCQKVYDNIPGKFCCVPDERVNVASKLLEIDLPYINSLKNLLKASEIIYDHFGELYDIPLFAYEDLKEDIG